jgi:hypothetical protein
MQSPKSEHSIFTLAGLEKNLGRWDFFFPSSAPAPTPTKPTNNESAKQLTEEERMNIIDNIDLDSLSVDEPEVSAAQNAGQAASKKKRSKKKKSSAKVSHSKTLKWGNAEQICFTRGVGYDRIPNKGTYPLGLGLEEERIVSSVDELVLLQQQRLLQQAIAKGLDLSPRVKSPYIFKDSAASGGVQDRADPSSAAGHTPPPPPPPPSTGAGAGAEDVGSPQLGGAGGTLKGKKLSHRKRSNSTTSVDSNSAALAVASSGSSASTSGTLISSLVNDPYYCHFETRQYDFKKDSNPFFHSLGEDERITLLTSGKVDFPTDAASPHGVSVNPLTEINNEIKHLKSARDGSGCNCKHVKIDKLSVIKMKAELLTHGHLINYTGSAADIEKLSKTDLTKHVREVLKNCQLCIDNNCACVQMGIKCSAQLCGCARGGYHPGGQFAQQCSNPEGMDCYDAEKVRSYRTKIILDLREAERCSGSKVENK